MFAIRHRSRPRRSARFVPAVDTLASRIAPVVFVPPIEVAPIVSEPAPTNAQPGGSYEQQMAQLIAELDEMCITTPAEV